MKSKYGRSVIWFLVALLCLSPACSVWPNDNVSSEPRDKVLYEKAVAALERSRLDVANLTLQTLVNTYPDSEYASKAQVLLQDELVARCGESFNSDPRCSGRFATALPAD
jgi:outer membrane protein assembly factor BamD (BamD/ComL family)